MRETLLELLADPQSREPLVLDRAERRGDGVESGTLRSGIGTYQIRDGIPRFTSIGDEGQDATKKSFQYKWSQEESYGSEGMRAELHTWLLARYGFGSGREMREYFASRGRILDAGCGAGFATSAWLTEDWSGMGGEWVGLDITEAIDVAQRAFGHIEGTHFVQGDLVAPPLAPESFDVIFSEGVLHHTPSTERGIQALVQLLRPGGELMIYVYTLKAPIREFTDDYVREQLQTMEPDEAWEALRPLTKLGKALHDLHVEIDVSEDVALLGIKAGRYDVQRLIYWNVAKMFWNDQLTFDENHHLNFDWYAPRYAHRQTEEDVRKWFDEAGLNITRFDVQEAGFTVRGVRR
jgi:arsenite methyltransferase